MKRARGDAGASTFAFNFGGADAVAHSSDSSGGGAGSSAQPPSVPPSVSSLPPDLPAGCTYARLLTATGVSGWGTLSSQCTVALPAGTLVRVLFEEDPGLPGILAVSEVGGAGRRGVVPSSCLALQPSAADLASGCWLSGSCEGSVASQLDLTLGSTAPSRFGQLLIEPGLDSLIAPLSPATFMAQYFTRRALCIHASARRLAQLSLDLAGFDVPALVAQASKLVVWMRASPQAGGRMQYLDSSPEHALACYRAGHSLYFNPPVATQERYLRALAADLGMSFGTALDGAGGGGGDLEVFAVQGRHATPWHWDAQDNFTLQLRGSKRWRVAASGVHAPITNWHPASATAREEDAKVLLASGVTAAQLRPPPQDAPGDACFLLRPGSFLYVPAGMWHAVDAESQEEGSLSINFSCAGCRWGDVVARAVTQRLWQQCPGMRERVHGVAGGEQGRAGARERLGELLQQLPGLLQGLRAQDVLCDKAFAAEEGEEEEEEEEEVEEEEEEGKEEGKGQAGREATFSRCAQCVMHVDEVHSLAGGSASLQVTLHTLFAASFGASECAQGGLKWALQLPRALEAMAAALQGLALGERVALTALLASCPPGAEQQGRKLLRLLCQHGYLAKD